MKEQAIKFAKESVHDVAKFFAILFGVALVFTVLDQLGHKILTTSTEPVKAICIDFVQELKPKTQP